MKEGEIIEGIHRLRADMAKEAGYDVGIIFKQMKAGLSQSKSQGWKIASFPPHNIEKTGVVNEDPPIG